MYAEPRKEVAYLMKKYPQYAEPGGFKEIDAREFEVENALSRAQIYESATTALVHEKGAAWAAEAEGGALAAETVEGFLAALAYASHTRADAQFRNFTDAFVAKVTEGLPPAMRGVWDRLRPLIKRSRFSLLAWEPTVLGDAYLCAPRAPTHVFWQRRHPRITCALCRGDALCCARVLA